MKTGQDIAEAYKEHVACRSLNPMMSQMELPLTGCHQENQARLSLSVITYVGHISNS
jgi:hypothetical protein